MPASTLYDFRALEVHDFARIWTLSEMRRRLTFAVRNGLNTLVLHEPGIVDKIVFPAIYFGGKSKGASLFEISQPIEGQIERYATREFLNPFRYKYLVSFLREAEAAGVAVYLEDKEIWFKDFVVRQHPEAVQHGVFCPSQPFWWEEFLPAKYAELFIALPNLAGVVTSMGTGESRLAIGNLELCGCERCRAMSPAQWYRNMAEGMHGAFQRSGKKLVIRDFVFQREAQGQFAQSLGQVPADIAVSLKNTPHDFYPTFPDNPLIGRVEGREQWIEYDVHGQYFGWGLAPAIMIDDLARRLEYGRRHGAKGLLLRTDWEGLHDHSCFETFNLLNLYAAAALACDPAITKAEIYTRWLRGENLVADPASPTAVASCVEWLMGLLERTWPIVRGAMFVNGTVFTDSSCFHLAIGQAIWIAEHLHSLKDWSEEAQDALRLDASNAHKILAEKDHAWTAAVALHEEAARENRGLTPETYGRLLQSLDFLRHYAEGFRLTARIVILGRAGRRGTTELREVIGRLRDYQSRLRASPFADLYPANVLLDPVRLDCFLKDAERAAEKLTA